MNNAARTPDLSTTDCAVIGGIIELAERAGHAMAEMLNDDYTVSVRYARINCHLVAAEAQIHTMRSAMQATHNRSATRLGRPGDVLADGTVIR